MKLRNAPFYGERPGGTELYTGLSAISQLVPDTYHVAIGGHPYMIDLNQPFYRQYRRQLAQLIRTQADNGPTPGDQSMDPNGLWRRSFEDWSTGAQQRYLDRANSATQGSAIGSIHTSFWQSKGIDALTNKWQISLLPDTTQIRASGNTNLAVVVVGTDIYVIDGQTLAFATSLGGSFTTVTGTPAVTASSIATDGFNVWVTYGASGVYTTTAGAASATQLVTSAIDAAAIISYCNGRLMLASTNILYNIISTSSAPLPSPLLTTGNPNVTFTNFAEGNGAIYVGANTAGRGWIYGMTVTADGTALGAPVIQGTLPPGENVTGIYGYPPLLFLGTSLGVRMCPTATSGGVTLGSLMPTATAVKCLTGWQRWVWFGWTTYDAVSTGLGKIDVQNQVIENVLPAVCSDLMVTSQGAVTSVASYQGATLFAVSGLGFYAPSTTQLVASGQIDSGYLLYDLSDAKVAALLDVQALGPQQFGSYSPFISTDSGTFIPIGTILANDPILTHTFGAGPVTGQRFEVRLVLNRDATTLTKGPVITRWTLRSYPAPKRPPTWQLPLIFSEEVNNRSGSSQAFDPLSELLFLEGLASNGTVVLFQEGNTSFSVFVQDVQFLPSYTMETRFNSYFNGLALVTLVGIPAQF